MSIDYFRKIKRYTIWRLNYLAGNNIGLSLENRLFNSVCLIAIFIMVINIPFNFFSGLKVTALIFVFFTVLLGYSYYLSRFKGRLVLGVAISSLFVIILFAVNYFFSAGVRGASLISFMSAFILIMIVSPRKLYRLWGILCLVVVMVLLMLEYHYPQLVQVSYANERALFADMGVAYGTAIFIVYFSMLYLKEVYYREKRSADERALELERLNNEKLKLFSIISHDLQTPLSSLHSYIRLIANGRLTNDERKQVERGLANALHVTQEMMSNMLVWSQGQLQGSRVDLMPNNIAHVLTPVIDIQRIYANQKDIEMAVDLDESLHALVDRDMLQLVVRNLINNAIKFTPRNGRIQVSVKPVGSAGEITVEDNGIGIPIEQQAGLFSMKTRSSYGTNNEKGVGLGLFLCKEYVVAQSGSIRFESEEGKGTKFHVSLPLIAP